MFWIYVILLIIVVLLGTCLILIAQASTSSLVCTVKAQISSIDRAIAPTFTIGDILYVETNMAETEGIYRVNRAGKLPTRLYLSKDLNGYTVLNTENNKVFTIVYNKETHKIQKIMSLQDQDLMLQDDTRVIRSAEQKDVLTLSKDGHVTVSGTLSAQQLQVDQWNVGGTIRKYTETSSRIIPIETNMGIVQTKEITIPAGESVTYTLRGIPKTDHPGNTLAFFSVYETNLLQVNLADHLAVELPDVTVDTDLAFTLSNNTGEELTDVFRISYWIVGEA